MILKCGPWLRKAFCWWVKFWLELFKNESSVFGRYVFALYRLSFAQWIKRENGHVKELEQNVVLHGAYGDIQDDDTNFNLSVSCVCALSCYESSVIISNFFTQWHSWHRGTRFNSRYVIYVSTWFSSMGLKKLLPKNSWKPNSTAPY